MNEWRKHGLKHKLSDKYQYQSYLKLIFFKIRRELLIQAEGGSGNDFVGSDKMAIFFVVLKSTWHHLKTLLRNKNEICPIVNLVDLRDLHHTSFLQV